jgi:hypothetical protein
VWNIEKKKNSTRGYVEIHIQRPFFDNKKGIQKIVVLKIQLVGTCFGASSIYKILFLKKYQNLNFWWYFKVPQANGLWADFDKIWQFWIDSVAMAVADSMPSFERKKGKCHIFCKKCQNLV